MTPSIASQNSTSVRLSFPPAVITTPLKWAPFLRKPILTRLFLTPVKRAAGLTDADGAVVGTVRVGDGLVRVRARGRGPSVMMVHGWQGSGSYLRTLADELVAAGFTAVSFDMPAHGETAGRMTSLAEFAQTTKNVAAMVGPVHGVVAHSLGATAVALALRDGLEVQSSVLIAPMVSFDFALDEFAKMLELSPEFREITAQGTEQRVGITREEVDLLRLDLSDIPVTLVHDEDDSRTPFHYSQELAARWGQKDLMVTRGLGHKRILDDERVARHIIRQLRDVPVRVAAPLDFACAPEMPLD